MKKVLLEETVSDEFLTPQGKEWLPDIKALVNSFMFQKYYDLSYEMQGLAFEDRSLPFTLIQYHIKMSNWVTEIKETPEFKRLQSGKKK